MTTTYSSHYSSKRALPLRSDVVGEEAEVAVRRHEREHPLVLPALEADARMEGDVVQDPRIHQRHRQVGHSGELAAAVDLNWMGHQRQLRTTKDAAQFR